MATETYQEDIQDLWQLYQATKAQLEAVTAEKMAVLSQLTALRVAATVDASSISQSGEAGSESYTIVTLQARFDSLTKAEIDLSKLMQEQRLLAVKASPGFGVAHVPTDRTLLRRDY